MFKENTQYDICTQHACLMFVGLIN